LTYIKINCIIYYRLITEEKSKKIYFLYFPLVIITKNSILTRGKGNSMELTKITWKRFIITAIISLLVGVLMAKESVGIDNLIVLYVVNMTIIVLGILFSKLINKGIITIMVVIVMIKVDLNLVSTEIGFDFLLPFICTWMFSYLMVMEPSKK